MKVLKIQRKNLSNMKMVVSYLNFVFFIEVKAKSKYSILNFVFQFIKKTKWHFGYMDCCPLGAEKVKPFFWLNIFTQENWTISHFKPMFLSYRNNLFDLHDKLTDCGSV